MNRRSFLITASTLALAQLLAGCNRSRASLLQVRLLQGSIPVQLLKEFQRRSGQTRDLGFLLSEQLADLYALLQSGSASSAAESSTAESESQSGSIQPNPAVPRMADLLTLGDYWLAPAIEQNLIQPLNLEDVPAWTTLNNQDIWQTLVRRDAQGKPSRDGKIWAAPYRWGTLMIAYHAKQFEAKGWAPPTDWSDLWRSEFQRSLALPDSPRLVIGLVLKQLGRSVNPANLETIPDLNISELKAELSALQQQVKIYSSETYLQPLVLEDALLAVGWSNEILPLVDRDPSLAAVVPQSGTMLTADLWVHPAAAPQLDAAQSALLNQWIGFCWDQPIAAQLSLLTSVASPVFFGVDSNQLPPSLQSQHLLLPSPEILQKSEFLLPLSDEAINQYRRLWAEVRQTEKSR